MLCDDDDDDNDDDDDDDDLQYVDLPNKFSGQDDEIVASSFFPSAPS